MKLLIILCWMVPLSASYTSWQADHAYQKGDLEKAHGLYQEAVARHPQDMKALYNVGMTAQKMKQYALAESSFDKVASQHVAPQDETSTLKERAFFGRGDAQVMQQKYQEALTSYEEVLKINPENESAKKRIELVKKLMEEQKKEEQNNDQNADKSEKEQDGSPDQHKEQKDHGKEGDKESPANDSGQEGEQENKGQQQKPDHAADQSDKKDGSQQQDRSDSNSDTDVKDTKEPKQKSEGQEKTEQSEKKHTTPSTEKKDSLPESIAEKSLDAQEKAILEEVEEMDKQALRGFMRAQMPTGDERGKKYW